MRNFGNAARTDLMRLNDAISYLCSPAGRATTLTADQVADQHGVRSRVNRAKVADAMKGRVG